jgi:hypothetical protein
MLAWFGFLCFFATKPSTAYDIWKTNSATSGLEVEARRKI